MVLKEELCAWFKDLQPRKRIDFMCGLLDMCIPLELRFIGTVLEDIAKKDFNYLRECETKANIPSNLESMNENDSERTRGKTFGSSSLMSEVFRSKLLVYLALLHSNNTTCANVIFNLLEKQFEFILNVLHNKEIMEEICSILTLACHHPAFQFYQRSRLGEVLKTVEARAQQFMDDNEAPLNLPQLNPNARVANRPMAFCSRPPVIEHADKVRIRFIQVKGCQAKEEQQNKKGPPVYDVHTSWSNGEVTQVFLKYKEFQDIHHKLMAKFPEWQTHGGSIPDLPAHHRKYREEQKDGVSNLNAYLNELFKAPAYVLECDILTHALRNGKLVQMAMGNVSALHANPYFHEYPLYPGVLEYKYSSDHHLRMPPYPTYPYHSHSMAAMSPRTSQMSSSSTTSPTNSRPSSPANNSKANVISFSKNNGGKNGSQQNLASEDEGGIVEPVFQLLRLCGLEKYSENLKCYSWEKFLTLSKEELGKAGLPPDAQVKLRSMLDQCKQNPPDVNGLIEMPTYLSTSDPCVAPCQEALMNPSQPSSYSHQPYPSVSSLASPQSHTTGGDYSPANSEVCSPSLSPALLPSDSPQNSPLPLNAVRISNVALPPSTSLSFKAGRALQVDSSGSEDDRVSGVEGTDALVAGQGFGRLPLSNSLPLISQTSGPPGFLDKKLNAMPPIHMPADPQRPLDSGTPPGMAPATSVNGFISDSTSFMPHNACPVIPPRMNARSFKHAQPTHTAQPTHMAPSRHQNIVNMPGIDLSLHAVQNMNKNGNGLPPILPNNFMIPPPTQGNSVLCHPNIPNNAGAPNPSGGQPPMPPSEAGIMYPYYYYAHHGLPGHIPPHHRGMPNTMANSTVVMTTTQSHPAPPTSHSPSPVASVISSDQVQGGGGGGYITGNGEVLLEGRQDGSPTSPPAGHNMALSSVKTGPNSATPSPPLSNNKPTGNGNCDSANAPSMFVPQAYMIPIHGHGHSNGLVTAMPPPFSFSHPSNLPCQKGYPEVYLHYQPQGPYSQYGYGNGVYPHMMHTINNSSSNPAGNNGGGGGGSNHGNSNKSGCYNCGHAGHKAVDCKEHTMDSLTKPFSLNLNPSPKTDTE